MVALPGEPCLRGGGDAGPLSVSDRPGRIVEFFPRLHLDKDQEMPAGRDDVHFAHRAAPTSRQDAKALGDAKPRPPAFPRNSQPKRDLAPPLPDPGSPPSA